MDEKHPNRKKDKLNPYVLSIEDGCYYVTFSDGQGITHKVQISGTVYKAFDSFELKDISYLNAVSRHQEHSDLTETTLQRRAVSLPEEPEEQVFRKLTYQQLHNAIADLPDIQRRRVFLYFFEGYTYEQIAEMDGCTKQAVKLSVDHALKKLREKI